MRRHVPSKPDDLDFDARELAKAAARRAGLSLEEWAAAVLNGPNGRRESFPAHFRQPNDIDSIIARMARTARSKHPAGDDATLMAAATGSERQARDRQEKEQASHTSVALETMAIWIEGAEERLNEAARASADHQDRIASFLAQALSGLKDRLDTVERHVVSERAAPPRIEFPVQDTLRALAPLSETLVGLRMDMSRLSERLDHPSPDWTPAVESVRAEIESLRSAMGSLASQEDISALAGAMSDIARDLEPGRSNMDLRTLAQSIAALYGQVQTLSDEMARGAHRRIGDEISLIKSKIDRISETGIDRSVIDALTSQIVDLRNDLAHRAEPQQIARLSEDVAALGRHIVDLRADQSGRGDFSALKASLENVCSALSRTVAAQEAGNVPEQIRHLSQRLDILASRPEPANLDSIAEQLALLTERMVRLSSSRLDQADALAETLGRLSSQVEAVAHRELPSQEPLMQRFDRIEQELRQVGQRVDVSGVESMLRSIDEKLERAPVASGLDGLEQRITALAEGFAREPLDKASPEAQLRHLQDEAAGIAERAARAVLKHIGSSLPDAGDLDALKQGFAELKALQARTEAKTQQSLRAVHGALETLVARFSSQAPASQPGLDRALTLPARSAEKLPPADRLEAAVRRLHAAALSQIEEASSSYPEDGLTGISAAVEAGKTIDPHAPRRGASPPSWEADLGNLRASLIAAARRAAQNPAADRADPAASPPQSPDDSPADGPGEAASSSPSFMERIRRTLDGRPLLLGLAFLILAAGTARILSGELGSPSVTSLPAVQQAQEQAAGPARGVAGISPVLKQASLSQASSPPPAPAPSSQGRFLVDPGAIGTIPMEVPGALRQAALSGDAAAICEVAALAAEGRGFPQDSALAARLYGKAAEAGLPPAQERLAMMHEKGIGLERDARLAALWYERAAQGGNIRAMHNLATLLASGFHGKPDYAAAFRWYGEAAEAGLQDSQFNMGVLLARGIGARQDFAKAFGWFALAAAEGDADAARKRDQVAARLSAADLATAKASVAQWRPRLADPVANGLTPPVPGQTAALDRTAYNKS